ncbi:hypothetical protein FQN60_005854 [Etheostoma spectabile]|uniref:Uncharacterized protein n=1 Tax=Etheostoma spectabile TaxID=54343 RepID=A0A5J5CIC1_9PERO|nr:hypothetical protein FQN60_005854 [Etheostoma spectabile]
MRLLIAPSASAFTVTSPNQTLENQLTVDSLYQLSVDNRKVQKFRGWVLSENSAHVSEIADLWRDMGDHPEASLCRPEDVAAQRDLWVSVCPNKRKLMSIIGKFPASLFTLTHHSKQWGVSESSVTGSSAS